MYLFNSKHSNQFFKALQQSIYIAQSQKSYGVRHSVRPGSNPADWSSSSLPLTYAHTILLGGKIFRRRKNYAAAE